MEHPLYQRLLSLNPSGLPHQEATQLFLWIFCTLDILPVSLRGKSLDKETLARIFAQLSRDGLVGPAGEGWSEGEDQEEAWRNLVKELLLEKVALDFSFPKRAHRYLGD